MTDEQEPQPVQVPTFPSYMPTIDPQRYGKPLMKLVGKMMKMKTNTLLKKPFPKRKKKVRVI